MVRCGRGFAVDEINQLGRSRDPTDQLAIGPGRDHDRDGPRPPRARVPAHAAGAVAELGVEAGVARQRIW
jgi:hypothetical protein